MDEGVSRILTSDVEVGARALFAVSMLLPLPGGSREASSLAPLWRNLTLGALHDSDQQSTAKGGRGAGGIGGGDEGGSAGRVGPDSRLQKVLLYFTTTNLKFCTTLVPLIWPSTFLFPFYAYVYIYIGSRGGGGRGGAGRGGRGRGGSAGEKVLAAGGRAVGGQVSGAGMLTYADITYARCADVC